MKLGEILAYCRLISSAKNGKTKVFVVTFFSIRVIVVVGDRFSELDFWGRHIFPVFSTETECGPGHILHH